MISLPSLFIKRMKKLLGSETETFIRSLQEETPTSIRLNPGKHIAPEMLTFHEDILSPIPWCDEAFYMKRRPIFTLDPYLHSGAYYVQEASSMFLQVVLKQIYSSSPIRALDLCAAPGGKSTLLVAQLSPDSLLVANEVIKSRATILKENLIKWGYDNLAITNGDPRQFSALKGAFDLILVDAPCSGEGMFRKDPTIIEEWSENNLELCKDRQKRILSNVWDALAPYGYLIYSTCTYNPGENEDILEWLLDYSDATSVAIDHPFENITPGYSDRVCAYRFYPHKTSGEGFFIGVIQKRDGDTFRMKKEKKAIQSQETILPKAFRHYLPELSDYTAYLAGETYGIIPRSHAEFIQYLSTQTGVIYKGCEIGENPKGKIKPAHSLALYRQLKQDPAHTREIDLQTAIHYLKKENIRLESPKGQWILLTHRGLPIGWVKEIGNRINNYYPKEWRIRGTFDSLPFTTPPCNIV